MKHAVVSLIVLSLSGCETRDCLEGLPRSLRVISSNGLAICGATVEVYEGEESQKLATLRSYPPEANGNCTGNFDFPPVENEGIYRFVLTKPGFKRLEKQVEIAELPGCDRLGAAAFKGDALTSDAMLEFVMEPE